MPSLLQQRMPPDCKLFVMRFPSW